VRHLLKDLLLGGLLLIGLTTMSAARAAELTIDMGHGARQTDSAGLLARTDARDISVPDDVAYHRTMHYRAVPLASLLEGLRPEDHLQFVAADGFAAEIEAREILRADGAQAWLAIEDARQPWPALKPGKPGAGPFYLVWTHAENAHISPEHWPYQIVTIRRLAPTASRFPAMQPAADLADDSPVRRGFAIFQSHCLSCHTLNGQGDARLGPDLNIPHNPTEYLREDLLRGLIRNPQSLRQWPESKMAGFDEKALSEADLNALLDYLRHMAGRKAGSKN
jgi:mono/diheme cytochrome c family protein